MNSLIDTLGLFAVVMIVIIVGLLWPLAIIWALNTLFALGIAYTFWTWLAVFVLTISFGKAKVTVNKDK